MLIKKQKKRRYLLYWQLKLKYFLICVIKDLSLFNVCCAARSHLSPSFRDIRASYKFSYFHRVALHQYMGHTCLVLTPRCGPFKTNTPIQRQRSRRLAFGTCSVRISADTPEILTEIFRGLPQSVQANDGITVRFQQNHYPPNSFHFNCHLTVRRYTADIESVVK